MLTTFENVKASEKAAIDKLKSVGESISPFQDGKTFKVTDYSYKQVTDDGKVRQDAAPLPVLKTSIGDLYLSMVTRSKITADGEILTPNGTFNDFVRDIIASNSEKSNKEIMTLIVEGCKNKEIKVTREPYIGLSQRGTRFATSLVVLDF